MWLCSRQKNKRREVSKSESEKAPWWGLFLLQGLQGLCEGVLRLWVYRTMLRWFLRRRRLLWKPSGQSGVKGTNGGLLKKVCEGVVCVSERTSESDYREVNCYHCPRFRPVTPREPGGKLERFGGECKARKQEIRLCMAGKVSILARG